MNIIAPEEVGVSSARLKRINTVMQGYVDQNMFTGLTTMAARRGKTFHFECFGMMDVEANKPMQPDTIFRIYSMTKPVTTVAMMMLYEQGRFQLYDPVSKFIPEFKDLNVLVDATSSGGGLTELKREITIRDLLTHTAGLGYGLFEDLPIEKMYKEAKIASSSLVFQISLEEMVQKLVKLPLTYQPGSIFRYSIAADVIGYLIGLISGVPFDAFLEKNIFKPLGMNDTDFYVPHEKIDRFAAMYGLTEKSKLDLIDAPAKSPFTNPNYHPSGGGGLVSTTSDYMRFAQMMLNGGELDGTRLLSRKTIELMTTNHLPAELIPIDVGPYPLPGYGFGLGVRVMVNVPQSGILGSEGEYGWGGAAGTYFWVDPKEELIGVLMPQFLPSFQMPAPIRDIFKNLTYQALVD